MGGSSDSGFKRKMSPLSGSFSVFVSSILHTLFRFFSSIFVRFENEQSSLVNMSCSSIVPAAMPQKPESEVSKSDDDSEYYDVEDEIESPGPSFVFKFEYQTKAVLEAMEKVNACGHSSVANEENEFLPEKFSSRRYKFQAEKNVSLYEEEAKVASFVVKEASADDSTCGSMVSESEGVKQLVIEECVQEREEQSKVASFVLNEESADNSSLGSIKTEHEGVKKLITGECVRGEIHIPQDPEKKQVREDSHSDKEEQLKSQEHGFVDEKVASLEGKFQQEKEFVVVESASDSDTSSLCSSPELSFMGQFSGDGFLSETEFEERIEFGALEDSDLQKLDVGYEPDGFDEEDDEDVMKQLEELEESNRDEEHHNPKESRPEGFTAKDEKPNDGLENSEQVSGQDLAATDSEDPNTLETLWEHQELIEQLKMELKKVRGSGLPTILEESESPSMEDLKPWKIDEKYHHGDRMNVLHKFYKSYRERMRKFDILSYQKLYAIGFLQSKDTLETFPSCKSSTPAIKSFLLQNFGLCKPKKKF